LAGVQATGDLGNSGDGGDTSPVGGIATGGHGGSTGAGGPGGNPGLTQTLLQRFIDGVDFSQATRSPSPASE
jgi:hypothetical protein